MRVIPQGMARLAAVAVCVPVLGLGAAAPSLGKAAASLPAQITNAATLYQLPDEARSRQIPVRIRGVVVVADPFWHSLFVLDEQETCFYLRYHPERGALVPGDRIEIQGQVSMADGNTHVEPYTWERIGGGAPPDARRTDVPSLRDTLQGLNWVEVEDRVTWAMILDRRLQLALGSGTNVVQAHVVPPNELKDPLSLVDAVVRVRGMASASQDVRSPLIACQISVPGDAYVEMVAPAVTNAFALPLRAIENLEASETPLSRPRQRVQGFLVSQDPGVGFILQDHTATVEVETTFPLRIDSGTAIDVTGYPYQREGKMVLLEGVVRTGQRALGSVLQNVHSPIP